jgi:hypothetical protein
VGGSGADGVDFRVLGPLEVEVDGAPLDIGGPQLRVILALLLASAGRVVSVAAFVDGLWGQHAPQDADRTVRTYVSRLRKALMPAAAAFSVPELILTRSPGYLLLDHRGTVRGTGPRGPPGARRGPAGRGGRAAGVGAGAVAGCRLR